VPSHLKYDSNTPFLSSTKRLTQVQREIEKTCNYSDMQRRIIANAEYGSGKAADGIQEQELGEESEYLFQDNIDAGRFVERIIGK